VTSMSSIDGLSTGLDTTSIINQLMAIERRPQDTLNTRKSQAQKAKTELGGIRGDLSSLGTLVRDFRLNSAWTGLKATSSDPTAVSLTSHSSATTGAYSFRVTSLATAASKYSTNTFASTSSVVAPTGGGLFSASGTEALGFQSVSGSGFVAGEVGLEVLQSSTNAKLDSIVDIPAVPIQIDGANDGIDVTVDGFNYTITLGHATYNSEGELATALNDALAASGAGSKVTAQLNASNRIQLTTTGEGSSHTIAVNGGTALAALGLTAGATAAGTDGIVSVNGTNTTVTDASAGVHLTLPGGGGGTISGVLSGGLRQGTAQASQTSLAGASLAEVVNAVNKANLGYTAAAVNTGNGYRLQLTARETGAGSSFTPDPDIFGATVFTTLSAGTDAQITIEGANPYTVSSSTNTFSGLLPGVDVTVNVTTTTAVTVTSERDYNAVTAKMKDMVGKLNDLIGRINKATANLPGQERSVLQGSRETRQAADALRQALVTPVESSSFTSAGQVGLELTREGTIKFDEKKFSEALNKDPAALTKLFTDGTAKGTTAAFDRMAAAVDAATKVGEGYLYTAGESTDRRIDDYGRQIDAYEKRLTLKEASLKRTYANLEVALNSLQKQQTSLASQLGTAGR
jgi:flagellar hook-associated protein 2